MSRAAKRQKSDKEHKKKDDLKKYQPMVIAYSPGARRWIETAAFDTGHIKSKSIRPSVPITGPERRLGLEKFVGEMITRDMPKSETPMTVMLVPLADAILGQAGIADMKYPDDKLDLLHTFVETWCNRRTVEGVPFAFAGSGAHNIDVIDSIFCEVDEMRGWRTWDPRPEIADCLAGANKSMENWWMRQVIENVIEWMEIGSDEEPPAGEQGLILMALHNPEPQNLARFRKTARRQFNEVANELTAQQSEDIAFLRNVQRGEDKELQTERLYNLVFRPFTEDCPPMSQQWRDLLEKTYNEHREGKSFGKTWEECKASLSPVARGWVGFLVDPHSLVGCLVHYLRRYYKRGFKRVVQLTGRKELEDFILDPHQDDAWNVITRIGAPTGLWQIHPAIRRVAEKALAHPPEFWRTGREDWQPRELPEDAQLNVISFLFSKRVKLFKTKKRCS